MRRETREGARKDVCRVIIINVMFLQCSPQIDEYSGDDGDPALHAHELGPLHAEPLIGPLGHRPSHETRERDERERDERETSE